MTAEVKLTNRFKAMDTEQIKSILIDLNEDYSPEAMIIYNAGLRELQNRLSEADFIKFCEETED